MDSEYILPVINKKLLTVVIPTYNMEDLLGRCLESLVVPETIAETLEVLVINDGSKDRSSEIAHEYEEKYPNVFRVIDKKNGNYGSCVNRGLQEAKGKYIKILDADDWFDTQTLCEFINALHNIDSDLILTNFCFCNTNGETTERKNFNVQSNTLLFSKELKSLAPHMAMHAVTYKTENLRKLKYYQTEGISYTDQEWIFEPMTSVQSFTYLDLYLYQYTIGREGQTMDTKSLAKNMHHNLIVLKRLITIYNNFSFDNDIFEYLQKRLYGYAEYVYSLYLFNMKQMNITKLINFDKELKKSCISLYNYLGSLHAGKLPHVKLWRIFYYTDDHGINNYFLYRRYNFWR